MEDSENNDLFDELKLDLELKEMENNRVVPQIIDITDLKKEREMFELVISNVLDMVYGRGYTTSEELEKYLNSLIRRISDVLNSNNEEKINALLSGEFNKDVMYRGSDINAERKELPLYFILDIIIGILEKNNANEYYKNSDNIREIVLKLKVLRDKVSTLKSNQKFKSIETIDEDTLDLIIKSKGIFEVDKEKSGDFEYLIIDSNLNNMKMPIYRSDKDRINNMSLALSFANDKRLDAIAKRYFKSGEIPRVYSFNEELIDPNIDQRIKNILLAICTKKQKLVFKYNIADLVVDLMDDIEKIEQELEKVHGEGNKIEEDSLEDREIMITLARLRYRQKSSLWKFFHKKLNPNNLNFNNMTENRIDNLYRGR